LVAADIRLDVAYLNERSGLHDELRDSGATLFPLGGRGGRLGGLDRVLRLIRRRRPDLVHTTLFEADLAGRVAGRIAGVPVVSSLVSEGYGPAHLGEPGLRRWKVRTAQTLDAATARFVERFHVPARHLVVPLSERLHVPVDRFEVVPRGRDPNLLGRRSERRRMTTRGKLGIDDDAPVLIAVGRQEHAKGLDVLVEAFAVVVRQRPSARLFVAGPDGNATAHLRQMIMGSGLDGSARFLGARGDVPDLLCAADVFVLPSRREGLPGALLEALALETPVVASDLPAVREVFDGRAIGLIAPAGDSDGLAGAIATTIADHRATAERTVLGRERFLERYTADAAARGMIELYEKVGRSRRTTAASEAPGRIEHEGGQQA
jgi:glycosyltransferase involved in cell wall biosynthesis